MSAEQKLRASIGVPLTEKFIEAGGMTIRAMIAGSGPTVILVHGLNIGWGQWYAVIPALAKTRRVIALDLNGITETDRHHLLNARLDQLLLSILDQVISQEAPEGATVVGHSIGGWAALSLAARPHAGIKSVVTVNSVGFSDHVPLSYRVLAFKAMASLLAATVMRPNRKNIASFLGGVMRRPDASSAEFVDFVQEHVARQPISHPFMFINRLFQPFRFRPEFVLSDEQMGAVTIPVTVVHGTHDPLIPIERVRDSFEKLVRVKVVLLDDSGHVPPIESPAELIRLIEDASAS